MAKKNLKTKIDANHIKYFLETHDNFGLELFVYRNACSRGFKVEHGGFYKDLVTDKFRQFDIRTSYGQPGRKIVLSIECKRLTETYPLLISRVKRVKEESYNEYIVSEDFGDMSGDQKAANSIYLDDSKSFYKVGEYIGKSTIQIGVDDKKQFVFEDSEIFDKWTQAINSAKDLVEIAFRSHFQGRLPISTAVIPVLVVPDDTLWVADYDESGSLSGDPKMTDEVQFFINHEYKIQGFPPYRISHLHFLTKKGICIMFDRISNKENEEFKQKVFNI